MNRNDDSLRAGSGSGRDGRNQRRILIWSLAWAISYIAVTLGIKKGGWGLGMTLPAVILASFLGLMTVLAYRRFLHETDELRRKIEVEALALAFGVGTVGGLSYWLLAVSGAVPALGFVYVFVAMIVIHPLGVFLGGRRYS